MIISSIDKLRIQYRTLIVLSFIALWITCLEFSNVSEKSLMYGSILMTLGMGMRFWTNSTIHKGKEVCTIGLYSICRHPMYVGTTIGSVGLAVMLNHIVFIVIVIVGGIISFVRAKQEESRLAERLTDYPAYKAKVPLLPTPFSIVKSIVSGSLFSRWSLKLAYANGELTRLNLYFFALIASLMYLKFRDKVNFVGKLSFNSMFVALLILSAASFICHPSDIKGGKRKYYFIFCIIFACIGAFVAEYLSFRG